MKLLYITNGITGVGGLERVLSIKASYFADYLGYDVHIVSLNETAKKPFYTFSSAIRFHSLEVGSGPIQYIKQMRAVVALIKPDIISVCDDGLKGFTVPLWIGGKAKIIYERHASVLINASKWKQLAMQKLSFLFTRFIVLTQYNLSEWRSKNLEVISNPVALNPKEGALVQNPVILCVGSISYNKGYDLLLEAWDLIESRYKDWSIEVYGKGDSSLLHGKRVYFNPPVSDIQSKYMKSSILALPSRSEGFGMVLIEAMACGVPCVAFDCPCGPRDIIRAGEDGFLVENGNVEAFATKLSKLIEDESLRQLMGIQARINVQRYNIESVANQWDQLFKKTIKHE